MHAWRECVTCVHAQQVACWQPNSHPRNRFVFCAGFKPPVTKPIISSSCTSKQALHSAPLHVCVLPAASCLLLATGRNNLPASSVLLVGHVRNRSYVPFEPGHVVRHSDGVLEVHRNLRTKTHILQPRTFKRADVEQTVQGARTYVLCVSTWHPDLDAQSII